MLIIPFLAILFVLKFAAIALVYYAGPLAAIPAIGICLALAHIIEPSVGKPRRTEPR